MATPPEESTQRYPPPTNSTSESTVEVNKETRGVASKFEAPVVPGYQILSELGRGGMGVVYKAVQQKLNRIVALKMILSGGHAGPLDRERFLREAEAVARLQHPGIVQIYDIGEQAGLPYFSLEFCAGGSLGDRLKGTPIPPVEAGRLIEQLALAIDHAHQNGIIHRDLKPANVMMTSSGSSAEFTLPSQGSLPRQSIPPRETTLSGSGMVPKITDFGLAKNLDDQGHTATGTIMGTPSYMAPEQARGQSRAINATTDVYALGAVLYECLTGRPPFRAATPILTIMQVTDSEPVPPSQLQPGLSRDLETICLKCLQKDQARRYSSARELAEDLRRWLEGEPIKARPTGMITRAWRWCLRNPIVAGLLALVMLSLIVSFINMRVGLNSVERLARSNQQLLAASLAGRLDERIRGSGHAITLLGRTSEIQTLLQATPEKRKDLLPRAQQVLKNVLLANPDFSSTFVLEADGKALVSTNPAHPGRSYAFRDYYRQAIKGYQYRSKILIGTSTNHPGMYFSGPVRDEKEKVIGVVVVKMEAESLWQIIDGLEVGEGNDVYLVDEDGIIIADRNRKYLYYSIGTLTEADIERIQPRIRFQRDDIPSVNIPAIANLATSREQGFVMYTNPVDGAKRMVAYAPLKERSWLVGIDLNRESFTMERSLLAWQSSIGLVVVLGVLIGVSVMAIRKARLRHKAAEHEG